MKEATPAAEAIPQEAVDDIEQDEIMAEKSGDLPANPVADNAQLEELEVNGAGDDEEEDNTGYEENAEREEIIRERINRTQDQMRY